MLYKEQMGLDKDDQDDQENCEQNRSPSENRKLLPNLQELAEKRERERESLASTCQGFAFMDPTKKCFNITNHARWLSSK